MYMDVYATIFVYLYLLLYTTYLYLYVYLKCKQTQKQIIYKLYMYAYVNRNMCLVPPKKQTETCLFCIHYNFKHNRALRRTPARIC